MAEFFCYECNGKVQTGEKFTFTKKGSVHFDCFVSAKRKEIGTGKQEALRALSLLLDHQLGHLLNVLPLKSNDENASEVLKKAYKEIEQGAGETTRAISAL